MERNRIIGVLLILGGMIISGCAVSKETMISYNQARELFQRAALAGAKECAPCPFARAEAYLALSEHEKKHFWREQEYLDTHIKIVKEKSLEAIKLCEKSPEPPPADPIPKPAPPPPEIPKPEPLKPEPPKPEVPKIEAPPPIPSPAPEPPPLAEELKPTLVLEPIFFPLNKTTITPLAARALDRNGAILKDNPQIKVEIGGHTDSAGLERVNQIISEKRALSAKKYLQDKFGIDENRLVLKGYGSTRPIADNQTEEGRAKNRRVEFRIIP